MKQVKLGLIPAAGAGNRMGYLSLLLPKPLFPLFDRPIIHHVVDNMKSAGIERIVIPIHFQKDKIIEYFEKVGDVGVDLELVPLDALPRGIAKTIYSVKKHFDEPFMTILGDDITIAARIQNLISAFHSSSAVVVEGVIREPSERILRSTCCLSLGSDNRIEHIEEKPLVPFTNIRGCGLYIFSPEIFNYIERTSPSRVRDEVEITDTIRAVAEDGKAFGAFLDGININVNSMDDLLQAWLKLRDVDRKNAPSIYTPAKL